MRTRAVVLRDVASGPAIEDIELRDPRPGEALVRMVASGICGSDLHAVHGESMAVVYPMVLGHEGAGVIEALGDEAAGWRVGERVVLVPGYEAPDITVSGEPLHLYAGQGTMAEHCLVSLGQLVRVPDDVPLDAMALTGCGVLTGVGTVFNVARPAPEDSVLIIGCGGVGLNVMQAANLFGANPIIAVDTNPTRLALASEFGATHLIQSEPGLDLVGAVKEIVPAGVGWAYEVAGAPGLVRTAYDCVAGSGTCVVLAAAPPGTTVELDARMLMMSQKKLLGTMLGGGVMDADILRIIHLYRRGRLKIDELVGARIPFAEALRAIDETDQGLFARCLITTGAPS